MPPARLPPRRITREDGGGRPCRAIHAHGALAEGALPFRREIAELL